MARTSSTMKLPLGSKAPAFKLPNVDGKLISLDEFKGKPLLVFFACNHCPFVVHIREAVAALAQDYSPKGLAMVAINSNDVANYPDDSPEKMKTFVVQSDWNFPYLFDETQNVAKAYYAACTPDFFLFDAEHKLLYRGQLDDSRPGSNIPVTGTNLRSALDALFAKEPLPSNQRPSIGCNIKWKPGNEPDYF